MRFIRWKGTYMKLLPLLILFLLMACGDDSPFSEGYWDDNDNTSQNEDDNSGGRYFATLRPISSLSFVEGAAALDLDGNNAHLQIEMDGFPQNLVQGQVVVTNTPCQEFVANPPTTGTVETKSYNYTENGTRAALFRDLVPGETVEGKSLLVYAYALGSTTTSASSLFPLACGTIIRSENTNGTTGTTTAGTNSTTGTTTNGTTAGTLTGSTLGGTTGGVVGGTDAGGTAGGVAGSVTGGTTLGGTTGSLTGSIGGTTGGVGGIGGFGDGTATGGFNGSVGGTTGGLTGTTGF